MMFLIYSKDNCKYCDMAKQLISDYIDTECGYIEFSNPPTQVVEKLKETTGQMTYPFIYCGDTFIGGYQELSDHYRTLNILKSEFGYEPDF